MKINEGAIDRILRVIVGVVLLLMTPSIGGALGYPIAGIASVWGWIGIIPLVTGIVGFCPGYAIFGINTAKGS